MTTDTEPAVPLGLQPWDLLDPQALLVEVADQIPLIPGVVLLALVERPATRQRLRGVTVLWVDPGPPDADEADEALVAAMHRLGVGDDAWTEVRRRTWAIVVIVVRRGRTFPRGTDWRPTRLYFYTREILRPLLGDTILVTEHGWSLVGEDIHGLSPCAQP